MSRVLRRAIDSVFRCSRAAGASPRLSFLVGSRSLASHARLNIAGVYPPIVTPFDSSGDIFWEKLEQNMRRWETVPFRGYVVQGSNGEYAFMTEAERVELVARVKRLASPGKLVIAGSGCESTAATVRMTRTMAENGADAALVVTPCFYKNGMTDDALRAHFVRVADESPIPIILYSVPANTGVDLSAEVVIRLASHPNIVGLKDSGGDISKIGYIVHRTASSGFQVLAGSASFLLPAYVMGCVGAISALANVLGDDVCRLEKLFASGKMEEAKALQQRLIAPNVDVTRKFGVAGLKAALEWYGYYGGPTRAPLLPLKPDQVEQIRQDFVRDGFL